MRGLAFLTVSLLLFVSCDYGGVEDYQGVTVEGKTVVNEPVAEPALPAAPGEPEEGEEWLGPNRGPNPTSWECTFVYIGKKRTVKYHVYELLVCADDLEQAEETAFDNFPEQELMDYYAFYGCVSTGNTCALAGILLKAEKTTFGSIVPEPAE